VEFKRVLLEENTTINIKIDVPVSRFALWNAEEKGYLTNPGKYLVQVGASSEDIRLEREIAVR
jgi:hypothetical protein